MSIRAKVAFVVMEVKLPVRTDRGVASMVEDLKVLKDNGREEAHALLLDAASQIYPGYSWKTGTPTKRTI